MRERFTVPPPPDKSTALRDWVRTELRSQISEGHLHPGERITEAGVAAELAVSRVPVREAIRLLEAEGYLRGVPNRGVVVRELTASEIEEIFDVRGALESLAARLATRRASQEDIGALEQLVVECRRAIEAGHMERVGYLNREFHVRLREVSGNRFISDREEPLIGRLHWAFLHSPCPERVLGFHQSLVEAILARDEDTAAEVAAVDNEHNREVALNRWLGRGA